MMELRAGGYISNDHLMDIVDRNGGEKSNFNVPLLEKTIHPFGNHLCTMIWPAGDGFYRSFFAVRISGQPMMHKGEMVDARGKLAHCGLDHHGEDIYVTQLPLLLNETDIGRISADPQAPKIKKGREKGHSFSRKEKKCKCGWPCPTPEAHKAHLEMVRRSKASE